MILCCDIAEILRPTGRIRVEFIYSVVSATHYFSTHGWSLVFSFVGGALEEEPFVAAASFRALRSKKLAIIEISICELTQFCGIGFFEVGRRVVAIFRDEPDIGSLVAAVRYLYYFT